MRRIVVERPGGPDVMKLVDAPTPVPGARQALVRVEAAGVNFIDTYQRSGAYAVAMPFFPGQEAAGVVEAVGEGAAIAKGARVAWAAGLGAYASHAVVDADRLVALPAAVDTRGGAAVMLQGMTAHYLAELGRLQQGDVCLVHAAAGGVGLLLCQLASAAGARVVGTVSSEEKAALARGAGAHDVVRYDQVDFAAEVRRLTGGAGVAVVYDSVGKDTFDRSLTCLRPRGLMVLYGQSSGAVPPFDPQVLARLGSLTLTRPVLGHFTATRAELERRAGELFARMAAGTLSVRIGGTYPLAEAVRAHQDLEGRRTTGKLLLVP